MNNQNQKIEAKRLSIAKDIANALNDLNDTLGDPFLHANFLGDLEGLIKVDEDMRFIPNENFVSTGKIQMDQIPTTGEVIKVKPEWEKILRRHRDKCDDLQRVVKDMTDSGLKVALGDVKDLINNGIALYEQAEQLVKSNAGIFKLPAARQKFIDENTEAIRNIILNAKQDIYRVLAIESMKPLSIQAFDIKKGIVSISDEWMEKLKEEHTIRSTDKRAQALVLIQAVENSIKQLNDFAKANPNFGTGVTTFQDNRRSLVWLSGDGEVSVDYENLEFI